MARVEIYTKFGCPYCSRAKYILNSKDVDYEEYDLNSQVGKREEMMQRSNGRHTVPQVFIDGRHIGGCDDLIEADRSGRLDPLLAR
ncbi:glutaredoxin 3 [Sphingosinicella rhizophila]|uniref:Glutaredoxin n=1 Tax=Sphingosinicella rhizophila TaxID=3050082 RepID=A0ABU3Q359_9SPHN|nr:glutaredoxin 3 [Sphingosinicella sp. GR2756]MDT9597848.1 glutaredoxin 3 [Sphingosinicella sp. GR2756]